MHRSWWVVALVLFGVMPSFAPGATSPASLAQAAAKRFPQPVPAGVLVGRSVVEATESQALLGRVRGVVRGPDGAMEVVVSYGGVLGLGARLIAVPVDAMVLVGDVMEIVGLTPAELAALPSFDGGASPLRPDEVIRVGLAKPSH